MSFFIDVARRRLLAAKAPEYVTKRQISEKLPELFPNADSVGRWLGRPLVLKGRPIYLKGLEIGPNSAELFHVADVMPWLEAVLEARAQNAEDRRNRLRRRRRPMQIVVNL